jgi:hypothetical protein
MHYLIEQARAVGAEQLANVTGYTLELCRKEIDAQLLVNIAEIYVAVGDVCATLYTNTVAMVIHFDKFLLNVYSIPPIFVNSHLI